MKFAKGGLVEQAIIDKQFNPQLGFVRFLKEHVEFGTELGIGPGSGCLTGMSGNRGSRAEHLLSQHGNFFTTPRELDVAPNDTRSKTLGSLPKLR